MINISNYVGSNPRQQNSHKETTKPKIYYHTIPAPDFPNKVSKVKVLKLFA